MKKIPEMFDNLPEKEKAAIENIYKYYDTLDLATHSEEMLKIICSELKPNQALAISLLINDLLNLRNIKPLYSKLVDIAYIDRNIENYIDCNIENYLDNLHKEEKE